MDNPRKKPKELRLTVFDERGQTKVIVTKGSRKEAIRFYDPEGTRIKIRDAPKPPLTFVLRNPNQK